MNNADVVRLPRVSNDFVYHMLGHHDSYVLPHETVVANLKDDDSEVVRKAYQLLLDQGDKEPSLRDIAKITGFGKDKVARLLKK
jgi:hypothetical protein